MGTEETEEAAEKSPTGVSSFIAAMGFSGAGFTVSILAATAITSATEGGIHGALWTGAFLIIMFLTKAIAVRAVPGWSARIGPERLFLITTLLLVVAWGGAGLLVVLGGPATALMIAVAPVDGIANGVFAVESPLLSKAFLPGHSLAAANARVFVVWGIACAVGAIAAGLMISGPGAGWTLVARATLSIPLLLVIRRLPRTTSRSTSPGEVAGAASDAADEVGKGPSILADPAVRRVVILAVTLTAATAPAIAMIVPIAQSLGHTSGVIGASIVLAAMSVGGLLAPTFVRLFERGLTRGRDPVLPALIVTGLALAAFGFVSTFLTGRTELLVWAAIGLVFGGAELASQSTVLGQVVRVSGSSEARHAISTMKFSTNLAAPVGFVVWEVLLDTTGGVTAMFVVAALMIIVAFSYGRSPTLQVS